MPRKPRRLGRQPSLFEDSADYQAFQSLPPFASTPDEIRRAVERNAIQRGVLLIRIIVSLNLDQLLSTVERLGARYDKEVFAEACQRFGVDCQALNILDNAEPPAPYPLYFCLPEFLIEHPELCLYYRNIAMLSRKVMRGIGLNTESYEEQGAMPSPEVATEIATYLNRIISGLVKIGGVTPHRHIEMVLASFGDSLGGSSRNEVGRLASAEVVRYVALHFHGHGRLENIVYTLKGSLDDGEEEDEEDVLRGEEYTLVVTPDTDLEDHLDRLEGRRVKYRQLHFSNGFQICFDRQIKWHDASGKEWKIGPDVHSRGSEADMLWAAEIKGGADPAGSDEHWKTATRAFSRILDACEATGRSTPLLSFIATILVERVAREAQTLIDEGKLYSVYNLTQIEDNEEERQRFLSDMDSFLGFG
jgi:hypothetical protein